MVLSRNGIQPLFQPICDKVQKQCSFDAVFQVFVPEKSENLNRQLEFAAQINCQHDPFERYNCP